MGVCLAASESASGLSGSFYHIEHVTAIDRMVNVLNCEKNIELTLSTDLPEHQILESLTEKRECKK